MQRAVKNIESQCNACICVKKRRNVYFNESEEIINPHLPLAVIPPTLHDNLKLSGEGDCEQNPSQTKPNININSYKFSKPRIYVANDYPDSGETVLERLQYLAQNMGPKERTREYNDNVTRLMQLSKPNKIKKKPRTVVSINSINNGPTVKLIKLNLKDISITALMDTGSTHCLISAENYQKLTGNYFIPMKLHMKVAGHVLKDNVIGKANIPVEFKTNQNRNIIIILEFLIAHALNGYDAIIGADFLMNEKILTAITPKSLILSPGYQSVEIPLLESEQSQQFNLVKIKDNIAIGPNCSRRISATVLYNKTDENNDFCITELNNLKEIRNRDFKIENKFLKSFNEINYSLSNIEFREENYPDFQCTIKNNSMEELHLQKNKVIASLSSKKYKKREKR